MANLGVLWRTLTITKNPCAFYSLKKSRNKKTITFKNGCTYDLTWPQFRYLRDSPHLFTKYALVQLEGDLFKLETQNGEITCSAQLLPVICDLMQDYKIRQEKPDSYHLKNEKVELIGSSNMLVCIQEQKTGEYECDYQGKVVLDVGGFEGESAAYFWQKGAKKIIIYEPLASNVEKIRRNVKLNCINAEIHQKGIGKEDGKLTIHYDRIDPGFGIHSKGKKSIDIEVANVSNVIMESSADVAKFDCESAEESLFNVSAERLQKIPYYIIEVHSTNIRRLILNKFMGIGFTLKKEFHKHSNFSVLIFEKKHSLDL